MPSYVIVIIILAYSRLQIHTIRIGIRYFMHGVKCIYLKPEKARYELGKDARKRMAHYSKTM